MAWNLPVPAPGAGRILGMSSMTVPAHGQTLLHELCGTPSPEEHPSLKNRGLILL